MSAKEVFSVSTIVAVWSVAWFEVGLILIGTKGLSMVLVRLVS